MRDFTRLVSHPGQSSDRDTEAQGVVGLEAQGGMGLMVDQRGHGHTSCPHQAPGPLGLLFVSQLSHAFQRTMCILHPLVFAHRKHRPCVSTHHTPCALLHGKLLELHPSPLSSWTLWPCCCWAGLLSAERGQAERGMGTRAGRTEAPLLARLGVEWGEAAGGLGRRV